MQGKEWWKINETKEKHVQNVEESVNNWRWPLTNYSMLSYSLCMSGVPLQSLKVFTVSLFPTLDKTVYAWEKKNVKRLYFLRFFSKLLYDCQGWNSPSASVLSLPLSWAHLSAGCRWRHSTKWLNTAANFRGAFNNEFRSKLPWLYEGCSILLLPVAGSSWQDVREFNKCFGFHLPCTGFLEEATTC